MTTAVVGYSPFQATGFVPDPGVDLTFDVWAGYLATAIKMQQSLPWWLGDLLNLGEMRWGEKYVQAIEVTGLAYERLANYASVAGKCSFRNEKLSWTHHKLVSPLEPAVQRTWLDTAEAECWSSAEMRDHLKADRSSSEQVPSDSVEVGERLPSGRFMNRPIQYKVKSGVDGLCVYGSEELLQALMNVVDG